VEKIRYITKEESRREFEELRARIEAEPREVVLRRVQQRIEDAWDAAVAFCYDANLGEDDRELTPLGYRVLELLIDAA
jgi:hypothetical protein